MRRLNKEPSMPWAERVKLTKFVLASDKTPDSLVEKLVRRPRDPATFTADEKLQAAANMRVLRAQSKATFVTNIEEFVGAGAESKILLLQGKDDRCAVLMNGWALKRRFPDRIRLVDLDDAGHWLIYEVGSLCARFQAGVDKGLFPETRGMHPAYAGVYSGYRDRGV